MKYLKTYESFDENVITNDDIIDCIKNNKIIYTKTVLDYPEHNSELPLTPIDIDNNNDITVDINGDYYYTKLKYVYKIGS